MLQTGMQISMRTYPKAVPLKDSWRLVCSMTMVLLLTIEGSIPSATLPEVV